MRPRRGRWKNKNRGSNSIGKYLIIVLQKKPNGLTYFRIGHRPVSGWIIAFGMDHCIRDGSLHSGWIIAFGMVHCIRDGSLHSGWIIAFGMDHCIRDESLYS